VVLRPEAAAEPSTTDPVAVASTPAVALPAPTIATEDSEPAAAPELVPLDPVATATAPSPDLVALEVERRLETERERLDELRRQREQARQDAAALAARGNTAEPVEPRAAPSRAVTRGDEAPAEPAPRASTSTTEAVVPSTETALPARTETVAPETVATETVAPAPPPVRRGDLVQPGTPGLVDPELVELRRVRYPPLAKMRKIEGIVVLRVLVSETGDVLEVNLLRGVTPDVGIDQAAIEAVRGGSFRPATKDGVAVKAYKNVTVPFRL
jgi:protein TonB